MRRLILGFADRTFHIVGNLMPRLIYVLPCKKFSAVGSRLAIGVGSFSIWGGGRGGGQTHRGQLQYFFGGGGGIARSTYTHACTCTCMHTHVLNIHTTMHASTHMYAWMHSYANIHPNKKIIKSKVSDLYGKKQQPRYTSERGKFCYDYLYCLNLFEFAYIYTHVLLKSKQWISIHTKPYNNI